jgi:type IV secretory pathway VirB4 component
VIGGSSSGKTTLITFLCMMALKYPNMKQLFFDKLQGMRVFTEFMDGSYTQFEGDISLNPLQLDDNDINREFLNSFFQIMSGKDSAKDIKDIDDALSQVYEHLPKTQRNLKEFVNAIPGTSEDDSLKANLEIWSTGANRRFFSANKDSLDFATQISAFNMDSVFHNKKAPTLISYYIFHRLKMTISQTAAPSIVVIDEIPDYLTNIDFGKKVVEIILEIRKKDGIAILMGQSLSLFLDTEAGKKIIGSSIANLVLFPDTSIKEDTQKILNLTSEEFNYIKTQTNKRKPLLKRVNTGGSVQLNVDLSSLGNLLNIFNSSTTAVLKLERLKKKFPTEWKERYLND